MSPLKLPNSPATPEANLSTERRTFTLDEYHEAFSSGWTSGGKKTVCGHGSTMAATRPLRLALPRVFGEYGFRVVNDAGCGDGNWISHADLTSVDYKGYDVVQRPLFAGGKVKFEKLNIVSSVMRPCDLIICRDVLIHLCTADVLAALDYFRRSGRWLLATSYDNADNTKRHTEIRGFSPLDLTISPFNLGRPVEVIPEPAFKRYLGLWKLGED